MKKNIILFLNFIILLTLVVTLSGCNNSTSEEKLKNKVNEEIMYIDNELISIVNSLNNIYTDKYKIEIKETSKNTSNSANSESNSESEGSNNNSESNSTNKVGSQAETNSFEEKSREDFSMKPNNILKSDSQIDWDNIINRVENLYTVWTTIAVDLREIGVEEENIKIFENNIDKIAISVKQENKQETINNIIETYSLFPKFIKSYGNDENILQTKYKLLVCYNYANQENWELFKQGLTDLKMSYSNFLNRKSEYKGKEINIKNATTLIEEIGNSSELNDKEIFFIKYKYLMQELNNISSI